MARENMQSVHFSVVLGLLLLVAGSGAEPPGAVYSIGSTIPVYFEANSVKEVALGLAREPYDVAVAYRDGKNKRFGTFQVCRLDNHDVDPLKPINYDQTKLKKCTSPYVFHAAAVMKIDVVSLSETINGRFVLAYTDQYSDGWVRPCNFGGVLGSASNVTCGEEMKLFSGGSMLQGMQYNGRQDGEIVFVWVSKAGGVGVEGQVCRVVDQNMSLVCTKPPKVLVKNPTQIQPQNLQIAVIHSGKSALVVYSNWKNQMKPELLVCTIQDLHCHGEPTTFSERKISQIRIQHAALDITPGPNDLPANGRMLFFLRTSSGALLATACNIQLKDSDGHSVACIDDEDYKYTVIKDSFVYDVVTQVFPGSASALVLYRLHKEKHPCSVFVTLCRFNKGEDNIGGAVYTVRCDASDSPLDFEEPQKGDTCEINHIASAVSASGEVILASNQGRYNRGILASVGCSPGTKEYIDGQTKFLYCSKCSAGKYNSIVGLSGECMACESGKYNERAGGTGSGSCELCPVGKHHGQIGASSVSMCSPTLSFFNANFMLIVALAGLGVVVALLAYSYWRSTQTEKSIVVVLCSIVCFCFTPLSESNNFDDDVELDSLLKELEMQESRTASKKKFRDIYADD